MTAALAHRPRPAPVQAPAPQLTLLDTPAPEQPPQIKLSIVGTLQRRAEVRFSSDGRTHLCVQVVQPYGGVPFIAVYHGEPGHRPELEHMAEGLRPGAAVLLVGRRLELTQHDGRDALRLKHCDAIKVVDAATFLTDQQLDHPVDHNAEG